MQALYAIRVPQVAVLLSGFFPTTPRDAAVAFGSRFPLSGSVLDLHLQVQEHAGHTRTSEPVFPEPGENEQSGQQVADRLSGEVHGEYPCVKMPSRDGGG